MNFGQAVRVCFAKYFEFSGRAIRSEFWYWTLFAFLLQFCVALVTQSMPDLAVLEVVVQAFLTFPGAAVSVRRLHDLDKSGWLVLIVLLPFLGALVFIYWMCQPGTPNENQHGDEPFAEKYWLRNS